MPSPPPDNSNSLLNLLNPYASVARSVSASRPAPDDAPDSPSALLLRELQSESTGNGGGAGTASNANAGTATVTGSAVPAPQPMARGRSRQAAESPPASPTPKPHSSSTSGSSIPAAIRPSHILADTSSSDDEGPPASLMFDGGGQQTPTRRSPRGSGGGQPGPSSGDPAANLALPPRWAKGKDTSRSPGPFRRRPSSTSSSTQSPTSPGQPQHNLLPALAAIPAIPVISGATSTESSSHSPTTSTDTEELAMDHPLIPAARRPQLPPDNSPPTAGPSRTRKQGKHKYHALATDDGKRRGSGNGDRDRGGRLRDSQPSVRKAGLSDYNKALWKWVNVTDLDGFLQEVYGFYKGKGIWCIGLARVLNLLTTLFVIGFTTFLTSCIDYSKLRHVAGPKDHGRLDDVLVGQCMTRGSFGHMLFIIAVASLYIFQIVMFISSLPGLLNMYRFYTYLLGVPDADIQTMPWPEVVRLIGEIKNDNPVTSLSNGQTAALADMVGEDAVKAAQAKLDAHDIANRILRQENYLIALFNKDVLDLRVRLPVPRAMVHLVPPNRLTGPPHGGLPHNQASEQQYFTFGSNGLTKVLEWNLRFCLMGYLFDRRGQVRKEVVRDKGRKDLIEELRKRFIFMGVVNAIFAPIIVPYLLVYSFFRYFEEYHKNPSSIGSRQYTPYAQWRFREFNELPHLFERRLDQSYPVAKEYMDQFPKERTALIMRFVAFIAGSFAAVLLAATLIDPDNLVNFEITQHGTVLFYLGVFGGILAVARGMIPEENLVFDPEYLMRELVRYTHYLPDNWRGKLHSQQVQTEFGTLFQLKVAVFARELVSVLLTPFILWFSLPACSAATIDFFREFTVHVDGLGYVCSFAVFDFHRHGAVGADGAAAAAAAATTAGAPPSPMVRRRDLRGGSSGGRTYISNDNKMEKSFLHFKATHPDWQPQDPSSSVFLDRLMAVQPAEEGRGRSPEGATQPHGHVAGSFYAGGRGLGLGLQLAPGARAGGLEGGRERRGVDLDASHASHASRAPGSRWFQADLAPMEEEEDDGEAEAMGWDRHVGQDEEEDEDGGADRGLLRDAGDILRQVMNR